jgi:hypothetical protein
MVAARGCFLAQPNVCALSWLLVTERIVGLALPDKKYEHNQSSLYKVRCLG